MKNQYTGLAQWYKEGWMHSTDSQEAKTGCCLLLCVCMYDIFCCCMSVYVLNTITKKCTKNKTEKIRWSNSISITSDSSLNNNNNERRNIIRGLTYNISNLSKVPSSNRAICFKMNIYFHLIHGHLNQYNQAIYYYLWQQAVKFFVMSTHEP